MPNLGTVSPFVSRHGREIREIRFYKKSRPNLRPTAAFRDQRVCCHK